MMQGPAPVMVQQFSPTLVQPLASQLRLLLFWASGWGFYFSLHSFLRFGHFFAVGTCVTKQLLHDTLPWLCKYGLYLNWAGDMMNPQTTHNWTLSKQFPLWKGLRNELFHITNKGQKTSSI